MLPSGRHSDHKGRKWVPSTPPLSEVARSFELKLFKQILVIETLWDAYFLWFLSNKKLQIRRALYKKHVFLNSASPVRSPKRRGYNIFLNKNKWALQSVFSTCRKISAQLGILCLKNGGDSASFEKILTERKHFAIFI